MMFTPLVCEKYTVDTQYHAFIEMLTLYIELYFVEMFWPRSEAPEVKKLSHITLCLYSFPVCWEGGELNLVALLIRGLT